MDAKLPAPITIDEYILRCAEGVRPIVEDIRSLIKECAPDVVEKISYGMPGYFLKGHGLLWFGAYERHIGMYPTTYEMETAIEGVSAYKDPNTKGSLRFPLKEPIPYDLIHMIIEFRVAELAEKG